MNQIVLNTQNIQSFRIIQKIQKNQTLNHLTPLSCPQRADIGRIG